jgi:outer membrane protein insertion porin family
MRSTKFGSGLFLAAVVGVTGALEVGAQPAGIKFDVIRVAGNERLADTEVLQLCEISAARTYDDAALQRMVSCLGESWAFTGISLGTEGRDLIISVEEAPAFTGFLDISVSADTDRGVSAKLQLEDRDLFDQGYQGSFEIEVASEERTARAALVRPNLFGTQWQGGIALSYSLFEYDEQRFSFEQATVAPFLQYAIDDGQSVTFRVGTQFDRTFDIADAASPVLLRDEGSRTSPFISIEYGGIFLPQSMPNTRVTVNARQSFVGLGRDHLFSNSQFGLRTTTAVLPDRLNASFGLDLGHINEIGSDNTLALDRYQLGGTSFRGFAPRGIGPVDGGDRLGGNSYAVAQLETRSPLGDWGAVRFEGGGFIETGFVSGLSDTAGFVDPIDDSIKWRATAGVALTANIGAVPISIYYAEPFEKHDRDQVQEFGISIQNSF